jgi:hypothetical protein
MNWRMMMRVAVHDCFPNHETAEKELVHRFLRALRKLNWEVVRAEISDDVMRFQPDCVIATHYTTPKATPYPTIGMMTNPPEYFDLFPNTLSNVLSYDGYLSGSDAVTRHLEDLHFSTGKQLVIDEDHFFLSSPRTSLPDNPPPARRLFYVGMRWDAGKRHGDLFQRLAAAVPLDVYGPKDRWNDLSQCYRGRVPYDGVSMIDRIRESGIALCIHSPEHLRCGLPTMRIWEAVSAGAVVITDAAEVGRAHFGDNLLYIDPQSGHDVVDQVAKHVEWVRRHPAEADRIARQAHAIFDKKYCLERQFERLPRLLARIREASGYNPIAAPATDVPAAASPVVEYIVRAGTRPTRFVRRALDSLKAQSHANISVVLVWMGNQEDLDKLLGDYRDVFVSLKVLRMAASGVRSNALWAGLRTLTAQFFGVLDDDDILHPNHVATVLQLLQGPNAAKLARSGGIRVQEEVGHYEDQSHFHGPLGDFVPESRNLIYYGPLNETNLLDGNKYVLAHSWIAARELLNESALRDPHLKVLEDLYLYSLLDEQATCAFTWRATAEWNWRSESRDNACLHEPCFLEHLHRLRMRLTYAHDKTARMPSAPPPAKKPHQVSAAEGFWNTIRQWRRMPGRVRRGIGTLWKGGPQAFFRRLRRVGTH